MTTGLTIRADRILDLAGAAFRGYGENAVVRLSLISLLVLASACGVGANASRAPSTSQALTGTAEWLEFESPQVRVELFRDVARTSASQAGTHGAVLFPIDVNGEFIAAPALELSTDLLGSADAGGAFDLRFQSGGESFSDDRRDAFQGLSEREAAEQIARSLLSLWNVQTTGAVNVVRAPGAPYAAAWIDGELRLNPAFVYMAAAPTR